jgi:hypothetical protein
MATTSDHLSQPLQIAPAIESVSATSAPIPFRRVLGSTGASIIVHLVVLLFLSLFIIAQQDTSPPLAIEGHLSELRGDGEAALELSDPDLFEIQTTPLNLPTITDLIVQNSGAATEATVDLTAFATSAARDSGSGLPIAAAAIASGIEGRVQKAGGRSGEVQFSLAWQSLNDVDLHVIVPSGEHISFSHRTSVCKGNLDVDMNADSARSEADKSFSAEPVENVRWLDRSAPSGRYTVIVNQYKWRGGRRVDPFRLLVKLAHKTQLVEDEVSAWKSISVHRFQYVKPSFSEARREKRITELTLLQEREESQAGELFRDAFKLEKSPARDRKMMLVITRFPHTDASIQAMQELDPTEKK